jgi:DNA-directed RNA polymerase specialized sigma24 family protein
MTNEEWNEIEKTLGRVINKARNRFRQSADDVAQEARLAAWQLLVADPETPASHLRQRAKFGALTAMRPRHHVLTNRPTFAQLDEDRDGSDATMPDVLRIPVGILPDLELLVQSTGRTARRVAAEMGIAEMTLSDRRKRARARVAAWWERESR